ncbi:MAG TPA: DUF6510 family protein [Solirubrobacteraceae bacterium]|jgi:ribosomal protein S27E
MADDDQHTDGNAMAGMLSALITFDPTTVMRRCQSCGSDRVIADHRAYHGAGMVLRCPSCDDIAMVVAEAAGGVTVELRGAYRVAVAV